MLPVGYMAFAWLHMVAIVADPASFAVAVVVAVDVAVAVAVVVDVVVVVAVAVGHHRIVSVVVVQVLDADTIVMVGLRFAGGSLGMALHTGAMLNNARIASDSMLAAVAAAAVAAAADCTTLVVVGRLEKTLYYIADLWDCSLRWCGYGSLKCDTQVQQQTPFVLEYWQDW